MPSKQCPCVATTTEAGLELDMAAFYHAVANLAVHPTTLLTGRPDR